MPFMRKSITFRITLLFAFVSTTVLLLLGLLIGSLVERHFEELDMELLGGKLELLRHAFDSVQSNQELEDLPKRLEDALVGHHGLAVIVLTSDGKTIYQTEGSTLLYELFLNASPRGYGPVLWTDRENRSYRGISATVPIGMKGVEPLKVALYADQAHHDYFMRSFRLALWIVMSLAALITGFLGWLATHRGLAPLRNISRSASNITASHLDQRLPVAAMPVELVEVAETMNAMLVRLEESFRRLSDFSSNLAHELRTPVNNLLTQTQVTLSKTRSIEKYQEVLASNAEEFERLSHMIADMLFLAKSDDSRVIPNREEVDLAVEVNSVLEFYDAISEEKNVSLNCSGNGTVSGDRSMLRRAISNLLSNAVRHTPEDGRISVHIDDSSGVDVVLTVENTGKTIAPEHLPRLFDRFYRADASRQNSGDGVGLGLAIVRSIAQVHGGTSSVRSEDGVTTFEIRLPI